MTIDEAIPHILKKFHGILKGERGRIPGLSPWTQMTALDTFECMIRLEDTAQNGGVANSNPRLDQWACTDPEGLKDRLRTEPRNLTLAVLLTISPKGMGELARHLSFLAWMDTTRAANRLDESHFRTIRCNMELEDYLLGHSSSLPPLKLPYVLPFPVPSMLRVVQNFRFRKKLLKDLGYQQAMKRYIRFFC